jgi:prephenate dehydrogenase
VLTSAGAAAGGQVAADLHVVGAGLIGASIGLALHGADVVLSDTDADRLDRAVARGAGRAWDGRERARLLVAAVPPRAVAPVLATAERLGVAETMTHVSSVQTHVQHALEETGVDLRRVCGGHPLAGREQSGPDAALADLFRGRPWVLCPGAATGTDALDAARSLASACGGVPVVMAPDDHDRAVALVSHLPQVAASAVAARLLVAAPDATRLAGPGLQDTTRIAGSDTALWVDVLSGNAAHVAPLVHALAADLARLATALDAVASAPAPAPQQPLAVVEDLLQRGRAGRSLVPVKRGAHDEDFVAVQVSVPDRPGQLAGVLVTAADAGVNVEDVHVEHLPGRPRGILQLLVHTSALDAARAALAGAGWDVIGPQ